MLGDKIRDVLAENSLKFPFVPRACLNINSVPLKPGETPTTNSDLRYSRMEAYIVYKPYPFRKYRGRDFLIRSDMFTQAERYRFKDIEDVIEQSKEIKELAFVLQWSNLTEELLAVAKELKQVQIPLPFDILKYRNHLQDIIEAETGERPEAGLLQEIHLEISNDKRVEDDILNTRAEYARSARKYRASCKIEKTKKGAKKK